MMQLWARPSAARATRSARNGLLLPGTRLQHRWVGGWGASALVSQSLPAWQFKAPGTSTVPLGNSRLQAHQQWQAPLVRQLATLVRTRTAGRHGTRGTGRMRPGARPRRGLQGCRMGSAGAWVDGGIRAWHAALACWPGNAARLAWSLQMRGVRNACATVVFHQLAARGRAHIWRSPPVTAHLPQHISP